MAAHKVTLNWKASQTDADHDAPATYEVKRSNIAMGPFNLLAEVPAMQLDYVDNDVKSGESWSYIITAKLSTNESGPSNEVTVSIPFLVPGAPSELAAIAA